MIIPTEVIVRSSFKAKSMIAEVLGTHHSISIRDRQALHFTAFTGEAPNGSIDPLIFLISSILGYSYDKLVTYLPALSLTCHEYRSLVCRRLGVNFGRSTSFLTQ
jgi:hypothetical protein